MRTISIPKLCYDCGKPLDKSNETVEHVPAKNLFEGFDEKYKINRITVPACYDCNQKYSKIDQEIRDVLAMKNDDPDQKKELTAKGARSILRRSNWKDRTHIDVNGNVVAVDFSYNDLRDIHIKNFKALFYRKYGIPIPENFIIDIISDGDDDKIKEAQVFYDYATFQKPFEISGHADVFKFILKDMTHDPQNDNVFEFGNLGKALGVVGVLVYHEEVAAIIIAGTEEFVEKAKRDKSNRG